jgi:excisionase family DNA binding protein
MVLTVTQVADVAEVSPRTVRRHIQAGRLPAAKVGRDWAIREEDAGAWVKTYAPYDTLRGSR